MLVELAHRLVLCVDHDCVDADASGQLECKFRRKVRQLAPRFSSEIWQVRTRLPTRPARVLFVLERNEMNLLHGFIKKERTTPKTDLDLARQRLKKLRSAS